MLVVKTKGKNKIMKKKKSASLFIKRFYSNLGISHNTIINEFWDKLYRDIEATSLYKEYGERYNEQVIKLLNEYKKENKFSNNMETSENELQKLQMRIEDLTKKFEECSIFNETPNLIKLLIGKDLISAKSYLYKNIPQDIYNTTIAQFGEYTLEAIIIYVLAPTFSFPSILKLILGRLSFSSLCSS